MIFYGLSGTGKTTVANIAAKSSNNALYRLNATNASVSDIKNIVRESDGLFGQNGILLMQRAERILQALKPSLRVSSTSMRESLGY